MRRGLLLVKGYPFTLSSDENMLKPVLPGLRLATPLSSSRKTWVLLELTPSNYTECAHCP